jgi:hypothetical protein
MILLVSTEPHVKRTVLVKDAVGCVDPLAALVDELLRIHPLESDHVVGRIVNGEPCFPSKQPPNGISIGGVHTRHDVPAERVAPFLSVSKAAVPHEMVVQPMVSVNPLQRQVFHS